MKKTISFLRRKYTKEPIFTVGFVGDLNILNSFVACMTNDEYYNIGTSKNFDILYNGFAFPIQVYKGNCNLCPL
jgi:hypothetical protein